MSVKIFWLLRDIKESNVLNYPLNTDIKKPNVLHIKVKHLYGSMHPVWTC